MRPCNTRLVQTVIALSALASAGACGLNESPSTSPKAGAPSAASAAQVKPDPVLVDQVPADIKKAGVIRMATQAGYPPFGYMDADGKTIIGLDIDLSNAIGAKLGVKVEPVNTSFDAIIPALQANKVDMAMASIGDTKEREKQVDFATYYWNGTLILVPKGNPKGIKADQACGVKIGVIRGSLQQTSFLPAQAPKCTAKGLEAPIAQAYQDGPQAQLALKSGRIDGVMQDAPPLLDQAKKNADTFEVAGPLVRNPNPGGVAFPKGSALAKPVNAAINELIEEGTYATIVGKWNLKDIAIDASEINGSVQ